MTPDLPIIWREHQATTFPLAAMSKSVHGKTLLQLDVTLGKILTDCLKTDGVPRPMAAPVRDEFTQCMTLVAEVLKLPDLTQETRNYFDALQSIGSLIPKEE